MSIHIVLKGHGRLCAIPEPQSRARLTMEACVLVTLDRPKRTPPGSFVHAPGTPSPGMCPLGRGHVDTNPMGDG
eukprot:2463922-Prymnesium_polylepis.1